MITVRDTVIVSSIPILVFFFLSVAIFGTVNAQVEKEQVFIKDNIKNYTGYGSDQISSDYRDIYNPAKAFDNLLPTTEMPNAMWSDYDNSGFIIHLQNKLDKSICSADILQSTPKNSPFTLTVGSKTVEGVLDSTLKSVTFPECAKNVEQIKLNVKAPEKWTSISEIKLFSEKKIPPPEPPVCPPGTYWDSNLEKCVENIPNPVNQTILITNSTINFDVTNSTLKIKADKVTDIIIDVNDVNVTTTNSNNTNYNAQSSSQQTTPIGTPLNDNDNNEDKEDDNNKDKKDKDKEKEIARANKAADENVEEEGDSKN